MTLKKQIRLSFSLLFAVIAAFALISLWGALKLVETQKAVSHTLEVLDRVEDVIKTLDEAENGLRGYVISGQKSFLTPFNEAQKNIRGQILGIREMTADNPNEQERIDALNSAVDSAMAYLRGATGVSSGRAVSAEQFVNNPRGRHLMDEARAILTAIEDEESSLLSQRLDDTRDTMRSFFVGISTGAILIALLLFYEMRSLVTSITVPLRRLGRDADRFGRGESDSIPVVEGRNEISRLSESISQMARERKKIEQRAQDSEERAQVAARAREDMLAIVSHDLKNPLAVINLSSEILMRQFQKEGISEDVRSKMKIITKSSMVMASLINDLLQAAAIEAGKLQINAKTGDIGDLVAETEAFFSPLAAEKEIRFTCEVKSKLPSINFDYERLRQAVFNIVGNALKFTPSEGTVKLSTQVDGGRIFIAVEDSGPGIKKVDIPNLFDRYYRAKETKKEGTGLGLFIAKAVITAHGGQIWLDPSYAGPGTRFVIGLPLNVKDVSSRPKPAEPVPNHSIN